jgi:hypothetical protein
MVTLAKPLARQSVTDVEFLQKVRAMIERDDERFICNAIEVVGRQFGTPQQITDFVYKVRDIIDPYAYYSLWAMAQTDPGIEKSGLGWQKRGRLKLIDQLIREVAHG